MKLNDHQIQESIADYFKFLDEINVTEIHMQISMHDNIRLDGVRGRDNLYLDKSSLTGLGLFTSIDIEKDKLFAIVSISNLVFFAGRFTNHSPFPNTKFIRNGNTVHAYALTHIDANSELFVNYRDHYNK